MFLRKPEVVPLGITQMAWPLAQEALDEEVQRQADRRGFDLKTPLGQFQAFAMFANPVTAARYFRLTVIVRLAETDWYSLQNDFAELNVSKVTHGFDEGVHMIAFAIEGSLLDWCRLGRNRDEDVKLIVDRVRDVFAPTKLWSQMNQCNNAF